MTVFCLHPIFAGVIQPLAIFIHNLWTKTGVKILLALFVGIFIYLESHSGRNDLDIFLAASVDLFHGVNIYSTTYFDGYHYYYSVLFATLIHPLAYVEPAISKSIWMLFNIFLLFRIWKLCSHFLPITNFTSAVKTLFGFLLFLFCLRFIKGNLHLGQMTIVMLALSIESVYQAQRKQLVFAALLLALAINIKLLPVVLIPYFVYRAQWRLVVYNLLFIALMYWLPALWLGYGSNNFLLSEWWKIINPHNQRHIVDLDEASFHGMTTFLAAFFTDNPSDPVGLQNKRNLLFLNDEQLFMIITCVRMVLVTFSLWFLRTWPLKGFGTKEKTWWEVSYLLLVVPLIFPHQQHYAFIFCLPALAWLIYWILSENISEKKHFALVILTCIVYATFNLSLLLGTFNAWYNHYKILTFGSLLLIFLLAFAKPRASIGEQKTTV